MNDNNKIDDEIKPLLTNKYELAVLFVNSGLTVINTKENGLTGSRQIKYTEICNYLETRFPSRILTVSLKANEITKILSSRNTLNDPREMFDVEISVTSLIEKDSNQLLPARLGAFKAVMQESDAVNNMATVDNGNMTGEQNVDINTTVNFFLFREDELKFGLNTNINALYSSTSLMSLFTHGMMKGAPGFKFVISKFDHDPQVPKFLVPRIGIMDFIELIHDEFGMYRSGYNLFIEDDVIYFLNKEEDAKVKVGDKDYHINLEVRRQTGEYANKKVYSNNIKSAEKIMNVIVKDSELKQFVNNKNVLTNDPMYISPRGNMSFKVNSSSRELNTVRKITEVPHIESYKNMQHEYIDVSLSDISLVSVNPLTTTSYIDSAGILRKYRVCFKQVIIDSGSGMANSIRAFRILKK